MARLAPTVEASPATRRPPPATRQRATATGNAPTRHRHRGTGNASRGIRRRAAAREVAPNHAPAPSRIPLESPS
jgi:hypothetical protein